MKRNLHDLHAANFQHLEQQSREVDKLVDTVNEILNNQTSDTKLVVFNYDPRGDLSYETPEDPDVHVNGVEGRVYLINTGESITRKDRVVLIPNAFAQYEITRDGPEITPTEDNHIPQEHFLDCFNKTPSPKGCDLYLGKTADDHLRGVLGKKYDKLIQLKKGG